MGFDAASILHCIDRNSMNDHAGIICDRAVRVGTIQGIRVVRAGLG